MTERRRFPCRSFPSAIDGELAKLVLHNPSQNRLTQAFFAELGETIAEIGRSGARAALLSAEGPDFSFGGDIVCSRLPRRRWLEEMN